eukprot:m.80436 g.80436  ORF g.80436 m.80436 type:complete len:107 (+) comp12021_c0_seq1:64-384(+)
MNLNARRNKQQKETIQLNKVYCILYCIHYNYLKKKPFGSTNLIDFENVRIIRSIADNALVWNTIISSPNSLQSFDKGRVVERKRRAILISDGLRSDVATTSSPSSP